ncbi:MAG: hypothetical protein GY941_21610 [Planctomycetes bacterium]|nr:hypothetical protein [Planctomycetota bacterium]
MTKASVRTRMNGNFKYVVGGVGMLITLAGIVFGAGVLSRDIQNNTEDIAAHHEDGCKPSIEVRQKIAAMQRDDEHMHEQVTEIRVDIKEIKDDIKAMLRISSADPDSI